MQPTLLLRFVCLLGLLLPLSATAMDKKSKEVPLLTNLERTYWPFSPAEREQMGQIPQIPQTNQYMPTNVAGPARRNPFPEMFRYLVWMSRHPDCEPVGLVLRPNEDLRAHESEHIQMRADNRRGKELPIRFLAQDLATATNHFVLISARVEKRFLPEHKFSGSPEEVAHKIRRELAKHGVNTVLVGFDSFALIEAPEHKHEFPHDRARAAEYERDRELWFKDKPRYEPRGLIYQPPAQVSAGPYELRVEGEQVRHLAAALAKMTGKEVFVQGVVEKKRFRAPVLQGDREEILKQLARPMDHADVRLVVLGPDALAIVHE